MSKKPITFKETHNQKSYTEQISDLWRTEPRSGWSEGGELADWPRDLYTKIHAFQSHTPDMEEANLQKGIFEREVYWGLEPLRAALMKQYQLVRNPQKCVQIEV